MKKLFAIVLSLMLLIGALTAFPTSATAAGKETILIAGSDFQVSGFKTDNVDQLVSTLQAYGINKVDRAFFCGDYTIDSMESATSHLGIQQLKNVFSPLAGNQMLFIQGNHDIETTAGLAKAGNNDPANQAYGAFVIHEDQYREWGNDRKVTEQMVNTLRIYLEQKHAQGFKKPVFVLCHIPLHWSNRTLKDGSGTDADLIVDMLNEYGQKGLNIIYLYGHNHSGGYDDFMGGGAVYLKKGDTMEVCHGNKREHKTRTINFTYMNAGFIGYYSTTEATADNAVTISVFRIQQDGSVIITRYDKNGVHPLKSKGVWHPDWSQEGYHATPNTLEYASSRKVTATDDIPVDPPVPVVDDMPEVVYPTEYTTTTYGGVVITKQTGTTTTVGEATTPTDNEQGEDALPSDNAEDTETTTKANKKQVKVESSSWLDAFPWWGWLIIGGVALLLIAAIVAIILLARPIK